MRVAEATLGLNILGFNQIILAPNLVHSVGWCIGPFSGVVNVTLCLKSLKNKGPRLMCEFQTDSLLNQGRDVIDLTICVAENFPKLCDDTSLKKGEETKERDLWVNKEHYDASWP